MEWITNAFHRNEDSLQTVRTSRFQKAHTSHVIRNTGIDAADVQRYSAEFLSNSCITTSFEPFFTSNDQGKINAYYL